MGKSRSPSGGSILLVDEYFGAEDDRFVEALREVAAPKQLAGFVDRWKADPRPWARQQVFAYLAEPLDCLGHNVVVKRLFKHFEAAGDDELLAAFLVVFDCLVRRERKRRWHYDWDTGETWEEETLVLPRNVLPTGLTRAARNPFTGKPITVPARIPRSGRLFSHRTRYYLRRRAWRYFRRMGYQRPDQYAESIARALAGYTDDDLGKGEHMLESWGLLHACFRQHEALEFGVARVLLREGRGLGELTPAPRFPELWREPEAMRVLLGLVERANSRLVRVWAMELVRREHESRLADLPVDEILLLLDHADDEVQQFAAGLLRTSRQLARLPLSDWLKLLETKNLAALEIICQAMLEQVTADRLELADCIRLARAEPVPVARLGFEFLKQRPIESEPDREAIAAVAEAACFAVSGELAAWALGILGTADVYDRELVVRFFDSLREPARTSAWNWLDREASAGYDDPVLWCRLLETPHDDLRLRLVDLLERRAARAGSPLPGGGIPGVGAGELAPVWCSVLLGVHRGGRQKAKATRQIARVLASDPSQTESLLPVLAVAVRSVRPAEARAGLAAVVGAVEACPKLAPRVAAYLPELKLEVEEVGG